MKFLSKYRKLRVVVRPSRKEIKEVAGDQVVIVHPAVICEFEGGVFDPHKKFEELQGKIQCCNPHLLKDVKQLEFMLKASPGYNSDFGDYFEMTPTELIAQKKQELSELMQQYGLADEHPILDQDPNMPNDVNPDGSYKDTDAEAEDEEVKTIGEPEFNEDPIPSTKLSKVPPTYKDLQAAFKKRFGFMPMGATYEHLQNALNDKS